MKNLRTGIEGLLTTQEAASWAAECRGRGERIVFTNGCYDLFHRGHVELLRRARSFGDALIVGLNSDRSVRRLKGAGRPLLPQEDRAVLLLALRPVDRVVLFGEDTPVGLIEKVRPDVLVKGAEYGEGEIVGAEFVRSYGGSVERVPMLAGSSTSDIIDRILTAHGGPQGVTNSGEDS